MIAEYLSLWGHGLTMTIKFVAMLTLSALVGVFIAISLKSFKRSYYHANNKENKGKWIHNFKYYSYYVYQSIISGIAEKIPHRIAVTEASSNHRPRYCLKGVIHYISKRFIKNKPDSKANTSHRKVL